MSRNKSVFGIGILCFTAGMYFGGALAEVKRDEFTAEEEETGRTWERQEHYISHYIRDYYVQIDGRDGDELEVIGIYTPVLKNGERMPDIAKELESKYNEPISN